MHTEHINPMGTEPIRRLIFRFALPATIALIVNALYNIVDQIFIGNMIGYMGNAATNVLFPLTVFCIAIPSLFGEGCAAYYSLELGKGDRENGSRAICNTIALILVVMVTVAVLCEIFMPQLSRLFGATDESISYALDYGRIIMIGFPFASVAVAMSAISRADGSPRYAMVGMVIGTVINIIFDPILIKICGISGAAIATIAGQIFNGIWFAPYFKKFKNAEIKREYFKPRPDIMKRVAALGVSGFILQICVVISTTTINRAMVKYGAASVYGSDIPMAAMGITLKISSIVIYLVQGIATGAQPIIGYNYGAGMNDRTKKAFWTAVNVSTAAMFICFAILHLFPIAIISLFGSESDLYNEFATKALRTYLLLCPTLGLQMTTGYFMQSVGRPLYATINTMTRQLFTIIPAVLMMSPVLGVMGPLWSGPVADGISFVVSGILLLTSWKKIFAYDTAALPKSGK